MSSRRQMLEFLSLSRLPSDYQEVEYIESSGAQYIDTGYVAYGDIEVICNALGTANNSSALYGARKSSESSDFNTRITMFQRDDNGYQRISPQFSTNTANSYTTQYSDFIETKLNKNGCYVNGSSVVSYSGTETITPNCNFLIFTFNEGGTPDSRYFIGKLKYLSIKKSGNLVRNFVPCYRKIDNVIGLYDLVGKQFYTNAGTGIFTKGNDVL